MKKKNHQLEPIGDRILIRLEPETTGPGKIGHIYIPESLKERPAECIVVAVGQVKSGQWTPDIKPGDRILISKYGGSEFEFNGEKLKVVKFDDVLARVGR